MAGGLTVKLSVKAERIDQPAIKSASGRLRLAAIK
jgi:hypothetical protein